LELWIVVKRSEIKIAVLGNLRAPSSAPITMGWIRWLRIGEALAKLGYQVDLITDDIYFRSCKHIEWHSENFRTISAHSIDWANYDVIKILFYSGFESFKNAGGLPHPFIITKLGAVVAAQDQEGIYFFGKERERRLQIQNELMSESKYVVTLTDANEDCLRALYPNFKNYLRVPTGVDNDIPSKGISPYQKGNHKICIYAGNIYDGTSQPELNRAWQNKLNNIGEGLEKRNIKLYFIGIGDTSMLNDNVICVPPVDNQRFWDYQYYADVGLALSDGPVCDNEASKIYYYLRGGLPVVAEDSLPNSNLIDETGYGEKVPFDDVEALCEAVARWAKKGKGEQERVMKWMAENHSWDKRVEVYDQVIRREFNIS